MPGEAFEEELVRRARLGDTSVAPLLVSLYGDRLLGFAKGHAPDLSDADREQIVELAVEAGVRAIGSFDAERGTLYSWFRQQIRYRTLDWRRRYSSAVPLSESLPEAEGTPNSDERLSAILSRALARLSIGDQDVLALRSVERLPFAEIGHRLGIKEQTARQRNKRALGRLKELLEADDEFGAIYKYAKEG